jgi:hypothetical protein
VLCKEITQAKDVYALNFNIWKEARHQTAHCFERSPDALFELVDALSSEPQARTLPELSLSPSFRRKWPSVYEALEDGRVNQRRWTQVWTAALLAQHQGPVWVSVDSTSIARPEAEASPDRGIIYLPNLPHTKRPVGVGWQFSTVMLLPNQPSSWGAILSQCRITSTQTAISVAVQQLEGLAPLLPVGTRVLADRWYATGPFVSACKRLHLDGLVRLKRNRKLYRQAPLPLPGNRGAPRKDGDLFQGSKPETWGEPDTSWHGTDHRGKPIQVQAWQHLHFRQARDMELTVYRVLRMGAKGTRRDPGESWFIWTGNVPLPLEDAVSCYQRRFSHEHTYRFLKQDLLWTKVHVRTAHQFERWSVVVATAMNQLVLARSLGQASYRPWERRPHVLTPRQVRRVMPALLQQLGTPARVPKPRGKSPGWHKGTPRTRPARFEVLKKPKPVPKTHRKRA